MCYPAPNGSNRVPSQKALVWIKESLIETLEKMKAPTKNAAMVWGYTWNRDDHLQTNTAANNTNDDDAADNTTQQIKDPSNTNNAANTTNDQEANDQEVAEIKDTLEDDETQWCRKNCIKKTQDQVCTLAGSNHLHNDWQKCKSYCVAPREENPTESGEENPTESGEFRPCEDPNTTNGNESTPKARTNKQFASSSTKSFCFVQSFWFVVLIASSVVLLYV